MNLDTCHTKNLLFITLLFLPAQFGLVIHSFYAPMLAEQLLSLTLALLCLELSHAARVDLKNLHATKAVLKRQNFPQDTDLKHFEQVLNSTFVLELGGFYLSLWILPLGAILVIVSQLWFNLLAKIELQPQQLGIDTEDSHQVLSRGEAENISEAGSIDSSSIVSNAAADVLPWSTAAAKKKQAILMANLLAFGLVCLWLLPDLRLWGSASLLALMILFILIKYALPWQRGLLDPVE